MKIQRWEETLFCELVDQKDSVTDERLIEAQLVYYYQRMDSQDLITAGGIIIIWLSFTVQFGTSCIIFCILRER